MVVTKLLCCDIIDCFAENSSMQRFAIANVCMDEELRIEEN